MTTTTTTTAVTFLMTIFCAAWELGRSSAAFGFGFLTTLRWAGLHFSAVIFITMNPMVRYGTRSIPGARSPTTTVTGNTSLISGGAGYRIQTTSIAPSADRSFIPTAS